MKTSGVWKEWEKLIIRNINKYEKEIKRGENVEKEKEEKKRKQKRV